MYQIPELLLVYTGCGDPLTGVRVFNNITGNETEMALLTYEDLWEMNLIWPRRSHPIR
jgi:hypothetical protein